MVVDFETIEVIGSRKFLLKNLSGFPMEIERVDASCGCTSVSVVPRKLAPNEDASVSIRLDVGDAVGPFEKTVSLFLKANDSNGVMLIKLQGTNRGLQAVHFKNAEISFGMQARISDAKEVEILHPASVNISRDEIIVDSDAPVSIAEVINHKRKTVVAVTLEEKVSDDWFGQLEVLSPETGAVVGTLGVSVLSEVQR